MHRTLTQKYDMHSLRALQELEADFLKLMAPIYGCEEEDVPLEIDLLTIYNGEKKEWEGKLVRYHPLKFYRSKVLILYCFFLLICVRAKRLLRCLGIDSQ
jgi:hypothetical protein